MVNCDRKTKVSGGGVHRIGGLNIKKLKNIIISWLLILKKMLVFIFAVSSKLFSHKFMTYKSPPPKKIAHKQTEKSRPTLETG